MKVKITNATNTILYVDVDGNTNTDDTIILGVKASSSIIVSKERLDELKAEFDKKLNFRIEKE